MKQPLKFIVVLVASVLTACTTQYYGFTKSEWENMTPFEQEKAKVEWRQVIAAKEKGTLGDSRAGISEGFVDHSKSTNENDRETNK
jgi:hypothetical protein